MSAHEAAVRAIAPVEHERWSSWMGWLFRHGKWNEDGSFTINADKAQRWVGLAATQYADLDDETQEHDRVEVRKALAALTSDPDVRAALVAAPCIDEHNLCTARSRRHPQCILAALRPLEAPS